MKIVLLTITLIFFNLQLNSQLGLIKESYTGSSYRSSDPIGFTEFNNEVFFFANNLEYGTEIWKTDGTTSGTVLLKDIVPYSGLGLDRNQTFKKFDNKLFFLKGNQEIWATDGTTDGTSFYLKALDFNLSYFKTINVSYNNLYFVGISKSNLLQVWRTDGTIGGSELIFESASQNLTIGGYIPQINGEVYFANSDNTYNRIWKTDGTVSGTVLVTELLKSNSVISQLMEYNNMIIFTTSSAGFGEELWKTDGTSSGTQMIKDINPSTNGSYPNSLVVLNNYLYFIANGQNGARVYKSDGTASGTYSLTDETSTFGTSASNLVVNNNILYYAGYNPGYAIELLSCNGDLNGTTMVKDVNTGNYSSDISHLTSCNGKLYFSAGNSLNVGIEPFVSDGTAAGTYMLANLHGGPLSSEPYYFYGFNNNMVIFSASTLDREPYISGPSGTYLLRNINHEHNSSVEDDSFAKLNGKLYFAGSQNVSGTELWSTDGTNAGTNMVKDIYTRTTYSGFPQHLTSFRDKVYFSAQTEAEGFEPWLSDGTNGGTKLLKNLSPSYGSSNPYYFYPTTNYLHFILPGGGGVPPSYWKTDGTISETKVLKYNGSTDFLPGSDKYMFELNGNTYFVVNNNNYSYITFYLVVGTQIQYLFKYDYVSYVGHLILNGEMYLFLKDTMGQNIYKLNSAVNNLSLVSSNNFKQLSTKSVCTDNYFYFIANDSIHGNELWKSDGTNSGTTMVKDILPGINSSNIGEMVAVDTLVYFSANDGVNGQELWRSDGTESGTTLLDIYAGSNGSFPVYLRKVYNSLYFSANNGSDGFELWKTSGDVCNTYQIMDLNPGPLSSNTYHVGTVNNVHIFSGYHSGKGRELWKLDDPLLNQVYTCMNDYTWSVNGQTYDSTGVYSYVHHSPSGCDSTYILDITFYSIPNQVINVNSCNDYTWALTNSTYNQSGIYYANLLNSIGCDSTVELHLNISTVHTYDTIPVFACESYVWSRNGATYTVSGFYNDTIANHLNCDSIITLKLTISSQDTYATVALDRCANYTWPITNQLLTASGQYVGIIPNHLGCDSIITLNLTIGNFPTTTIIDSNICDRYEINIHNDFMDYDYVFILTQPQINFTLNAISSTGCDSTVFITLRKVNPSQQQNIGLFVCDGSYYSNYTGLTYTSNTSIDELYANAAGCDSLITRFLYFQSNYNYAENIYSNSCESYVWNENNQTYSASGTYQKAYTTVEGCDSTKYLHLTIYPLIDTIVKVASGCQSYTWSQNNQTYTSSGNYYYSQPNTNNCDSIFKLELLIDDHTDTLVSNLVKCNSYYWPVSNQTYHVSGQYSYNMQSINHCDSIFILDLVITEYPDTVFTYVEACKNFYWTKSNMTYATSGSYIFNLPNSNTCDSVFVLELNINNQTITKNIIVESCNSYYWPISNLNYYTTGIYDYFSPNANACDTLYKLELTILNFDVNTFSLPSSVQSCDGAVTVSPIGGVPAFNFEIGNFQNSSNGETQIFYLCAGIHDLLVTDIHPDSINKKIVIPTFDTHLLINTYPPSDIVDSLGMTIEACDLSYSTIDTAFIYSYEINQNLITIVWNIIDANGTHYDILTYTFDNGLNIYLFQLSYYCQNQTGNLYYTVTQSLDLRNDLIVNSIESYDINVYPIPTTDFVTIKIDHEIYKLTIFDAKGRMLETMDVTNDLVISLKKYEDGVYMFQFENSSHNVLKRVVKTTM